MRHFGIIGNPLKHSQSKAYFDALFREQQIDADYTVHELERIEEVVPLLDMLDGMNVTSPYKEVIIPYLNEVDATAREIGAVNVVYQHKGYNTDWIGVTAALKPCIRPEDKQAIVFGSGGAANAVKYALHKMGLEVSVVSRKKGKGDQTYAELTKEVIAAHRIIANCTPLGMFPLNDELPELPWEGITKDHLLFDCIYNPSETLFLKKGKEHGAQTMNGYQMFVEQAKEATKIFRI